MDNVVFSGIDPSGSHFIPAHQIDTPEPLASVPAGRDTANIVKLQIFDASEMPPVLSRRYSKGLDFLSRPDHTLVARDRRISDSLSFAPLTIYRL